MGKILVRSSVSTATNTQEAEGFSRQDLDAVCFLLEKLDCGLSVEPHYDYEWCLSLLVYPHRAASDPAFFLYGGSSEIHLVDVSGDCYAPVGIFASFIGAITCIQRGVNGGAFVRPWPDTNSPADMRKSLGWFVQERTVFVNGLPAGQSAPIASE